MNKTALAILSFVLITLTIRADDKPNGWQYPFVYERFSYHGEAGSDRPWEYVKFEPANNLNHWWWKAEYSRSGYSNADMKAFSEYIQGEHANGNPVIRLERNNAELTRGQQQQIATMLYPEPMLPRPPPLMFRASDLLVLDGGGGTCSTSTWASACDTLANAASQVVRGDTVWVGDGIYATATFNEANSSTDYITIKKAIESDHGIAAGWMTTYGDGQAQINGTINFDTDCWVWDGQTGGGPGSWNSGFGFLISHSASGKGMSFEDSSAPNCNDASNPSYQISHIEYDGNDPEDNTDGGDSLYLCCTGTPDYGIISYVYIHDDTRTALVTGGNHDNWTLEYSAFTHPDSYNGTHSEIISARDDAWTLRYSYLLDAVSSGGVMMDGVNWLVYGNIFSYTTGGDADPSGCQSAGCSNGMLGERDSACGGTNPDCGGHTFVLNTILDLTGSGGNASGNFLRSATSGLGSVNSSNIYCQVTNYLGGGAKSENLFADMTAPGETNEQDLGSTTCPNLFETYGSDGIDFTEDLTPAFATDAANATYCAMFPLDMFGNTRGVDGNCERGAIELVSGGSGNPFKSTVRSPIFGGVIH